MTNPQSSMTNEIKDRPSPERSPSSPRRPVAPSPRPPVPLPPAGTVFLSGQIDRIDYNPRLNQWAILDYKTGESANEPEKTHRTRGGEWTDLQLPLYRHLARGLGVEGEVLLGYVTIPRDTSQIREKLAEWTPEELDQADTLARETIRRVLDQEFWQEVDSLPAYESEFSAICQDTVFGREATV
jgi:ATP-dependent helicase/nuclease subunit B